MAAHQPRPPHTLKLKSYSDPDHGRLAVKTKLIPPHLNITSYSYQKGQTTYLEEDCDASTFLDYCKSVGIEVIISHKYTNQQSPIRSYPCYIPTQSIS